MNQKTIIFAHVPKTAGTSLRLAVEEIVPENKILRDYGISSQTTSNLVRNTIYQDNESSFIQQANSFHFLFSHFLSSRIGLIGYREMMPEALLCTFLRDPIERIISEYYHFRNNYNYQDTFDTFIHQEQFINRQLRSIDFLPLSAFDFVGITENFPESLCIFNKISNLKLTEKFANRRATNSSVISISQAELDEFSRLNIEDIATYNEAISKFRHQTGTSQLLPSTSHNRFNSSLQFVDKIEDIIHGWAIDYTSYRPVEIEVLCKEQIVYHDIACLFRPDVMKAKLHVSGYCGFNIPLKKLLELYGNTPLVVRIRGGSNIGTIPNVLN